MSIRHTMDMTDMSDLMRWEEENKKNFQKSFSQAPSAPCAPVGESLLCFPMLEYAYDYVFTGMHGEYPQILLMVYCDCENEIWMSFERQCPKWLVKDPFERTSEGCECYIVKSKHWCVECNQIMASECFQGRCAICDNKEYAKELLDFYFYAWHTEQEEHRFLASVTV